MSLIMDFAAVSIDSRSQGTTQAMGLIFSKYLNFHGLFLRIDRSLGIALIGSKEVFATVRPLTIVKSVLAPLSPSSPRRYLAS
ncbi:MAG TPA: hypothetical protein VFE98_11150 [Candidatus Bathyarchaeia archaeon]|nr:hypothetical protein [Candidatus Bathyarchaeia archaeon]